MRRPWWVTAVAANSGASAAPSGPAQTAFDPAQIGAIVTLSNGDRTASFSATTGTQGRAYTLAGKSTGLWYMEFALTAVSTTATPRFGIAPAGASLTTGVGFGATEWAIVTNSAGQPRILNNNTNSAFGVAVAAGDIIGIAVNFTTDHIWFARNNVWMASGDPAGDTNPAATITNSITYFPCISFGQSVANPDTAVVNSPASQTYTPPTGFSVWN